MWNRSKSFRSKIMNYNLMLIVVMVLVCTTYVLINDRTIKKFNSTYTTYNELNQFYDNLKNLNDALQVYLYSPMIRIIRIFTDIVQFCRGMWKR